MLSRGALLVSLPPSIWSEGPALGGRARKLKYQGRSYGQEPPGFSLMSGRTDLLDIELATASGARVLAAGPGHDLIANSLPPRAVGMPVPPNAEPASDVDLVRRIKAISNVFEVGGSEPDYGYVEDLGDGRGYTVTQYGFCTYNDEVAQVIGRYSRFVPDTDLKCFLPRLPPLAPGKQALTGFPAAWRKEITSSEYLSIACDEEAVWLLRPSCTESRYRSRCPIRHRQIHLLRYLAAARCERRSRSPTAILKRTIDETGGVSGSSETEFLRTFLAIRKAVLHEPANRETREVWRASAHRVDALLRLLDTNPDLVPPIQVANADVDVVVL